MGLKYKILSISNSFNYYKNNFENLKNKNENLKNKIGKLNIKNENLRNKINNLNNENKNLKKEIGTLNNLHNEKMKEKTHEIEHLNRIIEQKQKQILNKRAELIKVYYYFPKDVGRKWIYKELLGKELNLESPKDFNEKINWLIVNEYGEREGKLTDKHLVKEYVKNKNIEDLFIPKTYKTYKNANEINLDELPEKFVLKCNHGSGSVFICQNKEIFDLDNAKTRLQESLSKDYAFEWLEYHYSYIDPCIIAEEYLDDAKHMMPLDYKFYSINGKIENILLCSNRDTGLKLDDYDLDWNLRNYSFENWKSNTIFEKPKNLEKMIKIAEELGKDFIFVRVDLYEINDKIYFGELTFTPACGTITYYRQEALDLLGCKLKLPCDN